MSHKDNESCWICTAPRIHMQLPHRHAPRNLFTYRPYTRESCHTWTSHVTHRESRHTHVYLVISNINEESYRICAAPCTHIQLLHRHAPCNLFIYIWHIRCIYISYTCESYHTWGWVMSHMGMSHVPHGNESCHTWGCPCMLLHTNIEPLPDSKISPPTTNIIYDYTYNL